MMKLFLLQKARIFQQLFYFSILFTIPSSIIFAKIFLSIIKTIGPTSNPIIPINLNPVYIAINVKIGCIPILLLTILGSINCFVIKIMVYNIIKAIPKLKFPFILENSAQGRKIVPEPKYWKCIYKPYSHSYKKWKF